MSEQNQIIFMQARLLRLASARWNVSIQDANRIFDKHHVFEFIRDCFGIFHTEGDEAVLDDIMLMINNQGAEIDAGVI